MAVEVKPHARITGTDRTALAREIRKAYNKGASVRDLAEKHNRSYGFIHRILLEAGVTMRRRGGPRKAKP